MLRHAEKLRGVHPNLVLLMETVGQHRDIVILDGARSIVAEREAIASGHSALKDPMDSKHVIDAIMRPVALAVDVAPYTGMPSNPVEWTNIAAFDALAAAIQAEARDLGLDVTWGGSWTHFKDRPHWELP